MFICGNELPTIQCSVQETSNPSQVHCPISFLLFLPLFPPPSSLPPPLPSLFLPLPSLLSHVLPLPFPLSSLLLFLPFLLSLILRLSTSFRPLPSSPSPRRLDRYCKEYKSLKGMRTLEWKPHLGLVQVSSTLKDTCQWFAHVAGDLCFQLWIQSSQCESQCC